MYEFKSEGTIFTTAKLNEYKSLCTIAETSIDSLKEAGYGTSFKGRYHRALFFTLKVTGEAGKKINMSEVKTDTLIDSAVTKAMTIHDYSVFIGKKLEKSDAVDEKDRDAYIDDCDDAWAKVSEVEEERQKLINDLNTDLTTKIGKLQPEVVVTAQNIDLKGKTYADYIGGIYNDIIKDIDDIAKYHGTPTYTKDQVNKIYKELTKDFVASWNTSLKSIVNNKLGDPSDLRNKLNKAENSYNKAKANFNADATEANETAYTEAKTQYEALNKQWETHIKDVDKAYSDAVALVDKIKAAEGTPAWTKEQLASILEVAKTRDVLPQKETNTGTSN